MRRYHYSVMSSKEYIHVNVSYSGKDTDLGALLKSSGPEKVLVDLRSVCPSLSYLERFYNAAIVVGQLESRIVALVMIRPLPMEVQLRTARDKVKAVSSIDEAYKWLGVGQDPQVH